MQERQNRNQLQWFDQYRASKTVLFWACTGSVILATFAGFSWGGWVTGGTAREMAEQSAAQGRQQIAAMVCVERFMAAPDMSARLTALQAMDRSYERGRFVQDGGWAIIPGGRAAETSISGSSADHRQAAALCADELARHEIPAAGRAEQINDETTAAQ